MSDADGVFERFVAEMSLLIEALSARLLGLEGALDDEARSNLLRDCVRLANAIKDLSSAFGVDDIRGLGAAIARAATAESDAATAPPVALVGARDAVAYLRGRLSALKNGGATSLSAPEYALARSLEALIEAGSAGIAPAPEASRHDNSAAIDQGELTADERAIMDSFATAELLPRDPDIDDVALREAMRVKTGLGTQAPDSAETGAGTLREMARLFALETEGDLRDISGLIASYEAESSGRTTLAAMARIGHKMKGAADMLHLREFTQVAARFERTITTFQRSSGASVDQVAVVLGRFLELFELCLTAVSADEAPSVAIVEEAGQLCEAVEKSVDAAVMASDFVARGSGGAHINPARLVDESQPFGRESLLQVDSARLDALMIHLSALAVNRGSLAAVGSDVARAQSEMDVAVDRLRQKSAHIIDAYPAPERIAPPLSARTRRQITPDVTPKRPAATSALAGQYREAWADVELERDSQTDTAVRALNEVVADVEALSASVSGALMRMGQLIEAQDIIIANIQHDATRMRLAPLAELAPRLQVLASYLAVAVRKYVQFTIDGEMTEIDRSLMRALAEPLNQLVRNAIVHGIEAPERRRAAGKPEVGSVWINAYYAGSEVVIEVGDDGRGANAPALIERAITEGALQVGEAGALTEEAALNLMFQPGVTTSERPDALAGSGLGLDEVTALIHGLKGEVSVTSSQSGTLFRIRAPMTLTVLPTIELMAGGQTFTAPFSLVLSTLTDVETSARRMDAQAGADESAGAKPLEWRLTLSGASNPSQGDGEQPDERMEIPAFSLGECLGMVSDGAPKAAIIMERRGRRVALLVDGIGAMRETMVRPLPSYLKRRLLRGVTVRPEDGAIALLVDTGELIDERLKGATAPQRAARPHVPPPAPVARVLIVDDSVTIRRTVDQMLTAAGFSTALARDGYEALEKMEVELPRVVILDVEMPRLSGYELLTVMRRAPKYNQTRVVMLTSRAGAHDERYARELGADEYLVKPCPQDMLISAVRRLLVDSEPS